MTLSDLLALAEKATPGPYHQDKTRVDFFVGGGENSYFWQPLLNCAGVRDAAYIAACSPEVVSALVRFVQACDIGTPYRRRDEARAELDRVLEGK